MKVIREGKVIGELDGEMNFISPDKKLMGAYQRAQASGGILLRGPGAPSTSTYTDSEELVPLNSENVEAVKQWFGWQRCELQ